MAVTAVSGSFDDLRFRHVRFLEEAAKLGELHVLLWPDQAVAAFEGHAPKFPLAERRYFLESIRYVYRVVVAPDPVGRDALPRIEGLEPATWVVDQAGDTQAARQFCKNAGIRCAVIADDQLLGVPPPTIPAPAASGRKKVLVTGCYDWMHTGHVRFFEEVSEYGDVYAVVGHDANISLLKGPGHPQFSQDERRYMVQAVRYVSQALVSTGNGWLDAEPEISRLKPDIYAVNEDGDRPEKRDYCREHGIEYLVLKRLPKPGLTRRQSSTLRGF